MHFTNWLVIVSLLAGLFGAYAYARDTILGKTKPNRVTWFMWALAPLIGATIAISEGADLWATLRTILAGFIPLVVFIASFVNKQSYWKLTAFDIGCGIFSLLALVIWLLVDLPRIAIIFAVLGDIFALIPTLKKAWLFSETETGITYIISTIGVLLIFPSIPVWNIENSAFQIYLLFGNLVLVLAIYRKKLFLPKKLS